MFVLLEKVLYDFFGNVDGLELAYSCIFDVATLGQDLKDGGTEAGNG